ncbi:hypothetical protein ACHAWF_010592 [Thalassiosira exigua]
MEVNNQQEMSPQVDEVENGNVQKDSLPSDASESSLLVIDNKSPARTSGNNDEASLEMVGTEMLHDNTTQQSEHTSQGSLSHSNAPHSFTASERFKLILSLWPYTIPLFTVYAAEYMLQAGVWSAIGFPVTSSTSRAQFYHYSNWTFTPWSDTFSPSHLSKYQAGVFLSRSSGNLCIASIRILWLMPMLQVANLYFFWQDAVHHFLYSYILLLPCFFAGLLGGAVYVQGYSRINMDMPVELKEFALTSACVADSLGILVADICSLFIQSCIYKENHVTGAVVDCPY